MTYHAKCEHLRTLLAKLKEYRPKGEKEEILREVRSFETELGFDLGNYNSSEFGDA